MKAKVLALAACVALGVQTGTAANPFSDVTPQDWAYQAVARLATEGVVVGYPDGTFGGERNITRYEMAQMVARAMAREGQLNAAQQAQLDKLAAEFADELKSLGVRVAGLEERAGRVKLGGDVRFTWNNRYRDIRNSATEDRDVTARLRLRTIAAVTPKTTVVGLFETNLGLDGKPDDKGVVVDQLFGVHKTGDWTFTVGQFPYTAGVSGVFYDGNFAGVAAKVGGQKGHSFTAAFGRVKDLDEAFVGDILSHYGVARNRKPEAYFIEYAYNNPLKFSAKAFFLQPTGIIGKHVQNIGVGASWFPAKFVNVHADYILNNKSTIVNNTKPYTLLVGASLGIAHPYYPKSFQIGVDYIHSEGGSFFGHGKYDILNQYMGSMYETNTAELAKHVKFKGVPPQYQTDTVKQKIAAGVMQAYVDSLKEDKGFALPNYRNGDTVRMPSYSYDARKDLVYVPVLKDGKPVIDPATGMPKLAPKAAYSYEHSGAKLWLASLKYVPVKGLLLEASYAFNAKAMDGEKLNNTYRLQATYYF